MNCGRAAYRLKSVKLARIVASRDYHRAVALEVHGRVVEHRRGHHADIGDVAARGDEAPQQGVAESRGAEARIAAKAIGDADIALLAGHGLFVTGCDIAEAHLRCVAFEQRCREAYQVEQLGGGIELAPDVRDTLGKAKFDGFWEAMARRELRLDPSLLAFAAT